MMSVSPWISNGPSFSICFMPSSLTLPATFNLQPDTCPAGQELVRELTLNASGQLINHKAACTP